VYGDRRSRARLEIVSPANPRIKRLVALRHRRAREPARLTLVEGYQELHLVLRAGARPEALYHCGELSDGDALHVIDDATNAGADVIEVSRAVFKKIAYRESPDGWLAVVPAVPTDLARLETGSRSLVLICEGVEKPGNLGAIMRTADAAGVAAVIATNPVTDWANPNLVRASKGTVFAVPVASASSAEVLGWLSERAMTVVATATDGDALLTDVDLTGPTAIVVGSEAHGLSDEWLRRADVRVRIPMFGSADSLNVATSAAIAVYEAVRQRMSPSGGVPPHLVEHDAGGHRHVE
jgi:TrmH family RNA methyltransferase